MKKHFLTTISLLLALTITIFSTTAATSSKTTKTTQTKASTSSQYKTYKDKDSGISMEIPKTWELDDSNPPNSLRFLDEEYNVLIDIYYEKSDKLTVKETMDELNFLTYYFLELFQKIDQDENRETDIKTSSVKKLVVNGVTFYNVSQEARASYVDDSSNYSTYLQHYVAYSNKVLYTFTFANFTGEKSTFDKVIKSIKFPKK